MNMILLNIFWIYLWEEEIKNKWSAKQNVTPQHFSYVLIPEELPTTWNENIFQSRQFL